MTSDHCSYCIFDLFGSQWHSGFLQQHHLSFSYPAFIPAKVMSRSQRRFRNISWKVFIMVLHQYIQNQMLSNNFTTSTMPVCDPIATGTFTRNREIGPRWVTQRCNVHGNLQRIDRCRFMIRLSKKRNQSQLQSVTWRSKTYYLQNPPV